MNIAILAAGAGDMYCGSCLRDNAMAKALLRLGHEVTLIPLYTPLRTDTENSAVSEVFYGGINVYLQHRSRFFRHTPRVLDRLLNFSWLVRMAGNWGAQTTPDSVVGLTSAILSGEEGANKRELDRLLEFLKNDVKPQVLSLPNLMFIGIAAAIKRALNIPVVCELTGEDIFLDAMNTANRQTVRDMIRARAADVTRFISTTEYYANHMATYLDVPRDRIAVVPNGLSPDFFAPPVVERNGRDQLASRPLTVGYLARICPEKGLDRLVEAMLLLRSKPGMENVRLRAAGYLGPRDRKWFNNLKRRIDRSPLRDTFSYIGEVDHAGKIAMLDSIDVFSVPTAYAEAKGIYVLEALARGVAVVQPAHGSFPELIAQTGGGVLVPPSDAAALAERIAELLRDPQKRGDFGRAGRATVESTLTEDRMADKLLELYRTLS